MCRMCEWLGEGQIWYLNPKNYAHRMYKKREPGGRESTTMVAGADQMKVAGSGELPKRETLREAAEARADGDMDAFNRIMRELNERELKAPGSQVIPLQDAFTVIDMIQGPIAAMMCLCRKEIRGEESSSLYEYSCMGLGTGMLKWERWPERYRGGVEFLSPSQAKDWLEYWDKRGYVHIIMQEGEDFIGGLCNCDYPGCHPIRFRMDYGLDAYLVKGEYVAKVDYSRCNGCGECVKRCQFAALRYEVALDKANIDPFKCFGCGLCATVCRWSAIELIPRKTVPALANNW